MDEANDSAATFYILFHVSIVGVWLWLTFQLLRLAAARLALEAYTLLPKAASEVKLISPVTSSTCQGTF